MGKVLDRIKKGVEVFCEDQPIGKVNRTIRDPEWKKTSFFTVDTTDKEILLPIEIIYEAKEGRLYLNVILRQVEKLVDVRGRDVCNEAGHIFADLKAAVYQSLDLARPFLDYQ